MDEIRKGINKGGARHGSAQKMNQSLKVFGTKTQFTGRRVRNKKKQYQYQSSDEYIA